MAPVSEPMDRPSPEPCGSGGAGELLAVTVGVAVGALDVVAVMDAEAPSVSDDVAVAVTDGVDENVGDGVGVAEHRNGKLCVGAAVRENCASVPLLASRTRSVWLMARVSQVFGMPVDVQATGGVQQPVTCDTGEVARVEWMGGARG